MVVKIAIALLLVIGIVPPLPAAETVTFKGLSKTTDGKPLLLKARLKKPKGDGPFPAALLLHGCRGITPRDDDWAVRLINWGYVTLQVDSFGPRGEPSICGAFGLKIGYSIMRAQDAYDAKSYLAGLPFVDRNRIAVMGWAHGAWTALYAVGRTAPIQNRGDPFRAAVIFYPYCDESLEYLDTPLLILIGELDDWRPAALCSSRMPKRKTAHEVILKVYPGAHHAFDWKEVNTTYLGHRLLYDPIAAADAVVQVKNFLAKHLR
jgi:dienelactone hydrolase